MTSQQSNNASSRMPLGGGLERFVVSADRFERANRSDDRCAFFGPVDEIVVPVEEQACVPAADENWWLGGMRLTRNRTPVTGLVRTADAVRRDGLDHRVLRVCRPGAAATGVGEGAFRSAPRQLVLDDLGRPFEDWWDASEWVTLDVSSQSDPELWQALGALPPGPLPGVGAALLADYLLALADRLPAASREDLPVLEAMTRDLVRVCLLRQAGVRRAAQASLAEVQRARVAAVVRQHIGSARLGPSRICQLTGISRSALYRLFESDGGVAAYVRAVRLEGVLADLSDRRLDGVPIARLAERWGFHNVAAFNRTFRRAFGCTPGDVRAGTRGGLTGAPACLAAQTVPEASTQAFPDRLPGPGSGPP